MALHAQGTVTDGESLLEEFSGLLGPEVSDEVVVCVVELGAPSHRAEHLGCAGRQSGSITGSSDCCQTGRAVYALSSHP